MRGDAEVNPFSVKGTVVAVIEHNDYVQLDLHNSETIYLKREVYNTMKYLYGGDLIGQRVESDGRKKGVTVAFA